jgi:hypothetical protein
MRLSEKNKKYRHKQVDVIVYGLLFVYSCEERKKEVTRFSSNHFFKKNFKD